MVGILVLGILITAANGRLRFFACSSQNSTLLGTCRSGGLHLTTFSNALLTEGIEMCKHSILLVMAQRRFLFCVCL